MQNMANPAANTHDHGPPGSGGPISPFARYSLRLSQTGVNSFSGAVAGFASGVVTCPLDVIKTKLQAQGAFRQHQSLESAPSSRAIYHGMIGTARTIIQQDGLRGMYRGLGPMLLGYLPTWAVYMGVYDMSREYYYGKVENKWMARVYASITAGACSTIATNPIWVIKTRLMSQVSKSAASSTRTPWHYKNTFDAARKMYASEGVAAFYSGLAPALLGLTHVAIQFPLYEYFKMRFTGLEMGESAPEKGPDDKASNHTVGILSATFLSKVCATTATYPHEVLRTRLQTQQRQHPGTSDGVAHRGSNGSPKAAPASSSGVIISKARYKGIVRTFKIILQEEGWRAFYNGMGTNMIRAIPAAMTTMLTYETMKGYILRLQEDARQAGLEGT